MRNARASSANHLVHKPAIIAEIVKVTRTAQRQGVLNGFLEMAVGALDRPVFVGDARIVPGRIASLEMLPDTEPLPHLICSRLIFGSGGGDEAGHHGDAR